MVLNWCFVDCFRTKRLFRELAMPQTCRLKGKQTICEFLFSREIFLFLNWNSLKIQGFPSELWPWWLHPMCHTDALPTDIEVIRNHNGQRQMLPGLEMKLKQQEQRSSSSEFISIQGLIPRCCTVICQPFMQLRENISQRFHGAKALQENSQPTQGLGAIKY